MMGKVEAAINPDSTFQHFGLVLLWVNWPLTRLRYLFVHSDCWCCFSRLTVVAITVSTLLLLIDFLDERGELRPLLICHKLAAKLGSTLWAKLLMTPCP